MSTPVDAVLSWRPDKALRFHAAAIRLIEAKSGKPASRKHGTMADKVDAGMTDVFQRARSN